MSTLPHPELLGLLVTAETLFAATGITVAPCPGSSAPRRQLRPTTPAETTHDEESTR